MTVILPVSSLCFLLGFPYRFILAERFPIVKAYKLGQYVESGDSWGDGFWQFSENRWHSRTISLTLTYNFGSNNNRRWNREDMQGGQEDIDDSGNSNMSNDF